MRDTPSHTITGLGPGPHTITLTVVDTFGNVSGSVGRVLVDAPADPVKKDVIIESKLGPVIASYTNPGATDTVDGGVTVNCTAKSGSKFAFGTTPVTCTAQDSIGNVATSSFNVVVRQPTTPGAVTNPGDTSKPLLSVAPGRRVRVSAGGFAPGSSVQVAFITTAGETIVLESTTDGQMTAASTSSPRFQRRHPWVRAK